MHLRAKTQTVEGRRIKALASKLNIPDDYGVELADGSIDGQRVVISDWGHSAVNPMSARPPIGRGVLTERGDDVLLDGEFFGDAPPYLVGGDGEVDDNVEWSVAFVSKVYEYKRRRDTTVKVVTEAEAVEVSPVARGAVSGTQTQSIRQGEDGGRVPDSDDNLRIEALYHTHRRRALT